MSDEISESTGEPAPSSQREARAWWLATRGRRAEWQSLIGAGVSTFSGRSRANFEQAQPGDPVLLYVSKPDHAIRAVGVVSRVNLPSGGEPQQVSPSIEVQLAFEVTNALRWRDMTAVPALSEAEPVKQRSSGTLFPLRQEEYEGLQALIVERNPELAAAFSAVDSGSVPSGVASEATPAHASYSTPPVLREQMGDYAAPGHGSLLPHVRDIDELQALTGLPSEVLEEARDLLEESGQIVLAGPPGTGKTWLARGLAALVAGDPARVRVVQFHPATSYEDFIEGLKPQVDALGRVTYAVLPGIFVRMCEEARGEPDLNFVLVIDEINRAPLARVFGELLYALEYRGPQGAVELSVSAGMGRETVPFFVPENLLILATMNSADRSLALVDYALRRRFRFVQIEPSGAVLDRWLRDRGNSHETRQVVLELFDRVNSRLGEMLDEDHRLGHSYFMLDPVDAHTLDRLWRTAIRPLIAEYFIPPAGELEEFRALFTRAVTALGSPNYEF